jgi:hypothetical protein
MVRLTELETIVIDLRRVAVPATSSLPPQQRVATIEA